MGLSNMTLLRLAGCFDEDKKKMNPSKKSHAPVLSELDKLKAEIPSFVRMLFAGGQFYTLRHMLLVILAIR